MEINLWPEFSQIPDIVTPKRILKEQGMFLEKSTSNFLKAEIISYTEENKKFSHKFEIIAPLLNNYSFTLLKLTHDVLIYPISVTSFLTSTSYNVENDKRLKEVLKEIFSDNKTQQVILNLLAQSKATIEVEAFNPWNSAIPNT